MVTIQYRGTALEKMEKCRPMHAICALKEERWLDMPMAKAKPIARCQSPNNFSSVLRRNVPETKDKRLASTIGTEILKLNSVKD